MEYYLEFEEYLANNFPEYIGSTVKQEDMNKIKILPKRLYPNKENAILFNSIMDHIHILCRDERSKLKFTEKGSIVKDRLKVKYIFPCYGIYTTHRANTLELVYYGLQLSFRVIFGVHDFADEEDEPISGRKAFSVFKKVCAEFGIDLEKFAKNNTEAIKDEFEKAELTVFKHGVTEGYIVHIDINSAYMSEIANCEPELRPVIEKIYDERKNNPWYKAILTHTYGFMQSSYVKYRFAHLSKYAVNNTNARLRRLNKSLTDFGCEMILNNTDGIWFKAPNVEIIKAIRHSCSTELGGIKMDPIASKINVLGPRRYEYIENGKYHAVYSGVDNLLLKNWGDIANYKPIQYKYSREKEKIFSRYE